MLSFTSIFTLSKGEDSLGLFFTGSVDLLLFNLKMEKILLKARFQLLCIPQEDLMVKNWTS